MSKDAGACANLTGHTVLLCCRTLVIDQDAEIPPLARGHTPEGTACDCCFLLPHCLHRLSVSETSPGFGISKELLHRVSSVPEAHVCTALS